MTQIIDFFKKNKAKVVALLTALLTFVISVSQIDMGTKMGIVCSILIVVIPVLISLINGEDMETTIKLLVNAITVIQQIVKAEKKQENKEVVGASQEDMLELTEEEIKELITKEL